MQTEMHKTQDILISEDSEDGGEQLEVEVEVGLPAILALVLVWKTNKLQFV